MSNNLPLYPLLRKDRNVDIVVCFDASADIKQENWLSVAEGYVKQRGIKGWPLGAGWPGAKDETKTEFNAADAATAQQAAGKLAETREEQRRRSQMDANHDLARHVIERSGDTDLGYCNGKKPPPQRVLVLTFQTVVWNFNILLPPPYAKICSLD